MFFVSKDTLGCSMATDINTQISKLTGFYPIVDPELGEEVLCTVANFTALKLYMLNWFRSKYYKQVKIRFAGQYGYVKFRKAKAWRDENYNRRETIPIYDLAGKGGKIIGEISRFKAKGDWSSKIHSVKLFSYDKTGKKQEQYLNQEEIEGIVTEREDGSLHKGIGYEEEVVYVYAINAIYQQLLGSEILSNLQRKDAKGRKIVPRVCVVDEVADGSWDFIFTFAAEELSRKDEVDDFKEGELRTLCQEKLGKDLWGLRTANPYSLSEEQIEEWDKLENAIKEFKETGDSVDVQIFIGRPRSPGARTIPGYPSLKIETLMEDFQRSEDWAKEAIDGCTENADYMPHPFEVDHTKAPMMPIYGDIPIGLESREVQISAYLVAFYLYNGVINYYKDSYVELAVKKIVDTINSPQASFALKAELLNTLKAFPYLRTMNRLVVILSNQDSRLQKQIRQTILAIFKKIMSEALEFSKGKVSGVKSYENLLHRQMIVNKIGQRYPKEIQIILEDTRRMTEEAKSRLIVIGLPFMYYQRLPTAEVKKLRYKKHGEDIIYVVPVISEDEEARKAEVELVKNSIFASRALILPVDQIPAQGKIKAEDVINLLNSREMSGKEEYRDNGGDQPAGSTHNDAEIRRIIKELLTGYKALVVDDEHGPRSFASFILRECGVKVMDFDNPQDALAYLSTDRSVKLIITDYDMPNMNGIQFLTKAVESGYLMKDVVLIMHTGKEGFQSEKADILRGFKAGYIAKPYQMLDLIKLTYRGLTGGNITDSIVVVSEKPFVSSSVPAGELITARQVDLFSKIRKLRHDINNYRQMFLIVGDKDAGGIVEVKEIDRKIGDLLEMIVSFVPSIKEGTPQITKENSDQIIKIVEDLYGTVLSYLKELQDLLQQDGIEERLTDMAGDFLGSARESAKKAISAVNIYLSQAKEACDINSKSGFVSVEFLGLATASVFALLLYPLLGLTGIAMPFIAFVLFYKIAKYLKTAGLFIPLFLKSKLQQARKDHKMVRARTERIIAELDRATRKARIASSTAIVDASSGVDATVSLKNLVYAAVFKDFSRWLEMYVKDHKVMPSAEERKDVVMAIINNYFCNEIISEMRSRRIAELEGAIAEMEKAAGENNAPRIKKLRKQLNSVINGGFDQLAFVHLEDEYIFGLKGGG